VLDANVLYPFTLRDTLLRAAADGYFQVCWSREILDEARRNLVASAGISQLQADRLLDAMTSAFPEALVSGYEHLIASMPNEPKDRHVTAVAVATVLSSS
jgi:predicted nucleic acid-binding protein